MCSSVTISFSGLLFRKKMTKCPVGVVVPTNLAVSQLGLELSLADGAGSWFQVRKSCSVTY